MDHSFIKILLPRQSTARHIPHCQQAHKPQRLSRHLQHTAIGRGRGDSSNQRRLCMLGPQWLFVLAIPVVSNLTHADSRLDVDHDRDMLSGSKNLFFLRKYNRKGVTDREALQHEYDRLSGRPEWMASATYSCPFCVPQHHIMDCRRQEFFTLSC